MSLTSKLRSLVSSPKGRQLIDRGQQELSKPENQTRIRNLLNRRTKRP